MDSGPLPQCYHNRSPSRPAPACRGGLSWEGAPIRIFHCGGTDARGPDSPRRQFRPSSSSLPDAKPFRWATRDHPANGEKRSFPEPVSLCGSVPGAGISPAGCLLQQAVSFKLIYTHRRIYAIQQIPRSETTLPTTPQIVGTALVTAATALRHSPGASQRKKDYPLDGLSLPLRR